VVISGRDTEFLASRLPLPSLRLIGNHGLEERVGHESRLATAALPYGRAMERAAETLADVRLPPGTRIERKRATLAIHFRQAADPDAAAGPLRTVLEPIAAANGLELRAGRLVLELRPPIPVDKGAVLERLVQEVRPRTVIFAGDDRTDADAFRALRRLRRDWLRTIAVGVASEEVARETLQDADIVVDGVSGLSGFLAELLRSVQP
jgi:trehalose 6-phosphate phosphatase